MRVWCGCVVATGVTDVAGSHTLTHGRLSRSHRPRPTVEYHVYVSVAHVSATTRHLRMYTAQLSFTHHYTLWTKKDATFSYHSRITASMCDLSHRSIYMSYDNVRKASTQKVHFRCVYMLYIFRDVWVVYQGHRLKVEFTAAKKTKTRLRLKDNFVIFQIAVSVVILDIFKI